MSESPREERGMPPIKCEFCSCEPASNEIICYRDKNLEIHCLCLDCAIAMHAQDEQAWDYCWELCAHREASAREYAKRWKVKRKNAFIKKKYEAIKEFESTRKENQSDRLLRPETLP